MSPEWIAALIGLAAGLLVGVIAGFSLCLGLTGLVRKQTMTGHHVHDDIRVDVEQIEQYLRDHQQHPKDRQ